MAFDGTTFRGLDDETVDDGINTDDLPLDVFVEQSISSNSRYLNAGIDQASVPYYGQDSDFSPVVTERVFCSVNQSRIMFWPILLTRGLESVKLDLLYQQSSLDTGGTNVECELRIVEWNSPSIGFGRRLGTTSFTLTATSGYEETTREVSLNGAYSGQEQRIAFVELWIQSDQAADTGTNLISETIGELTITVGSSISTPEDYRTFHLQSDTSGKTYDIIGVTTSGSSGRLDVYPSPEAEEDGTVFSVYETQFIRVRGASIQLTYDGDISASTPQPGELAAQRSIYATTVLPQLAGANSCYDRVRHVGFGPAAEVAGEFAADPSYLWVQDPVQEIQMDALLQDDITGGDEFVFVVCWTHNQTTDPTQVEARCDATMRVFDAGDTSWGDATVILSASSSSDTYSFPGNKFIATQLFLRENNTSGRIALREGHTFAGTPNAIAVTVVRGVVAAAADSTRHDKPARMQLDFAFQDFPFDTAPTAYICGYCMAAVGTYEDVL